MSQKGSEGVIQQMKGILGYIDSGMAQLKGDRSPQEMAQVFEADVYQMLERIGKLDEDSTEKEFMEVKQKLTVLLKGIGELRKKLEAEQKLKGDQSYKSVVDHLEDLQENLADLGYTYANKLESHQKSLTESAMDALSKKQASSAQAKMGKAENSLFEL